MQARAHQVDQAAFGKHPEVGIANRLGEPVEGLRAVGPRLARAERDQPGLDMFGKRAVGDGVPGEAPGEVALSDARRRPVDHLGREHRADASLLAEADQQRVDAGGVYVGEFGEVADAHHHLGLGMAPADVEVAAEAGGETEADRLQHRIEPTGHAGSPQPGDRLVEALHGCGHVGHHHHLAAPVGRGRHV